MGKYWIYGWKNDMWAARTQDLQFGESKLRYAASSRFRCRGMEGGDTLFIVSVKSGVVYLGGAIHVHDLVDRDQAATRLGVSPCELWPADEYVLAEPGKEDRFRPSLIVTDEILDNMVMKHHLHGHRVAVRAPSGRIEAQTFRTLRELIPGREASLLSLLTSS